MSVGGWVLADARLVGAHPGVVVRSAETGETLYSREGRDRLLPASNNKLFTSVAALEALGTDYRFSTTVLSAADREGATLQGDLYLKGGVPPGTGR